MMLASVVLPSPGGPYSSTWSSASPRDLAAWMAISRLFFDLLLPDELMQPLRTQLEFERRVVIDRYGRDNALAIQAVFGKNHDGAMVKRKGRPAQ